MTIIMNVTINNEYTNKDFAEALKELLDDKGWSYSQLSYKTELTASYLNQISNKKKNAPKNENIEKIAAAFNLKPEYFREYRNRRLNEKMLPETKPDKSYDVPLSPEDVDRLQKIIDEAKMKFKK